MNNIDVYVYGMTVLSTIHLLKGKFPAPDTYGEIQETYVIPGGEAANAAIVLSNLGARVSLDGCYLGEQTEQPLLKYLNARNVDCSPMIRQAGFEGWRDIVFCDGEQRTVFGWFVANLFGGRRLWTIPSEASIQAARCIALDPFFGKESDLVAELCEKHHKDYVTIDCRHDSAIARRARASVCSQEFLDREYPNRDYRQLLNTYRETCQGLVIFTFGSREIRYAAPHTPLQSSFTPFPVAVRDTLGAGDTFRAGVVYGVLQDMPDDETIRFAAACAAVACTRFPSVYQAPSMQEVIALMNSRATRPPAGPSA
ncbi:MAG TPA: carbohydrate kinase family protein [Anaerolineae bacterium]|nr:carbohydrate kinase family protein [Anaerolineae bacterium]